MSKFIKSKALDKSTAKNPTRFPSLMSDNQSLVILQDKYYRNGTFGILIGEDLVTCIYIDICKDNHTYSAQ